MGARELRAIENAMPNYARFIVGLFLRWGGRGRCGIVDFGAGIGTLSALIRARCGVTLICVEPDATLQGILAARGLPWAADLDDVTAVFDVVFLAHVLEHIADDRARLKRLYGKLPAGGGLFLFVPAFQLLWTRMDVMSATIVATPAAIGRQSRWRGFHHSPLSLRRSARVPGGLAWRLRGGAMSTLSPPPARSPPTTGSAPRVTDFGQSRRRLVI